MNIKLTTLIDNFLGENLSLEKEHGFSVLVELGNPVVERILFDTGQGANFLHNAVTLDLDLAKVDKVIISHGHWDHSGGFKPFVDAFGSGFDLFLGQGFFTPKYAKTEDSWDFKGNDFDLEDLKKHSLDHIVVTEELLEITPGVYLVTNFPRITAYEEINSRFYLKEGECFKQDHFRDEIVLVLETINGLVVVLGCSHPGVVNIVDAIKKRLKKPIYCIIGGTHLVDADDQRLIKTAEYLKELEVAMLGVSHCTGEIAMRYLAKEIPNFFVNSTGTVLNF